MRTVIFPTGAWVAFVAAAALVTATSARSQTVHPLVRKAEQKGQVRVIVRLKVAEAPKGAPRPSTRAAASERQKAIEAQRDSLVKRLAPHQPKPLRQLGSCPLFTLDANANVMRELLRAPEVATVSEDKLSRPHLIQSIPLIEADHVWNAGVEGTGSVVAILDTGVDALHPFLAGRVVHEACFSSNLCPNGEDRQVGAGAARPPAIAAAMHGTHVAGIAAGLDGVRQGVVFSGVARRAQVIAVQVFSRFNKADDCGSDPTPCVRSYTSDQIRALDHVFDQSRSFSVAAVNMSLGDDEEHTANCDGEDIKESVDDLWSAGIATVISAGNSSHTNGIASPACVSSATAVGATDNLDVVAGFSNSSPLVDLWAPGVQILSSVPGTAGLMIRLKSADAMGGWAPSSHYEGDGPGVHAHGTLTGDVDGDGKADLIFVGQGYVWTPGPSPSTWLQPVKVPLPFERFTRMLRPAPLQPEIPRSDANSRCVRSLPSKSATSFVQRSRSWSRSWFSNLRNWIYRLRKESRPLVEAAPASPGQAPARVPATRRSRLVPVRVVASAPKARLVEPSSPLLELALPTGVVVRFPPGTEPSYLRALLAAL